MTDFIKALSDCALVDGRFYLLKDYEKVVGEVAGICVMEFQKFGLEYNESIATLNSYFKPLPSFDVFERQVRRYLHALQTNERFTTEALLRPTPDFLLPDPCVVYKENIYTPGKRFKGLLSLKKKTFELAFHTPLCSTGSALASASSQKLTMAIEPFVLQHKGFTYGFDGTILELPVQFSDTVTLLSPPRAQKWYAHPYVFGDGAICFNGVQRWDEIGVTYSLPQEFTTGALMAAKALYEAKSLLESYFGDVRKVHPIEYFEQRRL